MLEHFHDVFWAKTLARSCSRFQNTFSSLTYSVRRHLHFTLRCAASSESERRPLCCPETCRLARGASFLVAICLHTRPRLAGREILQRRFQTTSPAFLPGHATPMAALPIFFTCFICGAGPEAPYLSSEALEGTGAGG